MDDDARQPLMLRECLRPVSKRLGLGGCLEAARVWSSWAEIAGPTIAEHAEPTSLRDGVLRIRTDSPAWATELGYLGTEIARRANAAIGKPIVAEVRVWTAPGRVSPVISVALSNRTRTGARSGPGTPERPPDPARALARARAAWSRR